MMLMEVLSAICDEDDFIDMNFLFSSSSPLQKNTREDFEFKIMSSSSSSLINAFHERSADELFHHGKLVPLLHLQKLTSPPCRAAEQETLLDEEDYCFFEWSNDVVVPHHRQQQFAEKRSKNWSSRFYRKTLNASKKYLSSLFTKPAIFKVYNSCSRRKLLLPAKKAVVVVENCRKTLSVSGAGTFFSSSSSSSSSTSTMPRSSLATLIINRPDNAAFKKRYGSARCEVENSIDGAIDYCKRSHAVGNSCNVNL